MHSVKKVSGVQPLMLVAPFKLGLEHLLPRTSNDLNTKFTDIWGWGGVQGRIASKPCSRILYSLPTFLNGNGNTMTA